MKKLVYDVGGTFIKYAVMDEDAVMFEKGKVATPLDSQQHFLDVLEQIYQKSDGRL